MDYKTYESFHYVVERHISEALFTTIPAVRYKSGLLVLNEDVRVEIKPENATVMQYTPLTYTAELTPKRAWISLPVWGWYSTDGGEVTISPVLGNPLSAKVTPQKPGAVYIKLMEGFVENMTVQVTSLTISPYVATGEAVPGSIVKKIDDWRVQLKSTVAFGQPMEHSIGWYKSLSDVEILARLIYAENMVNTSDQNAVARVIISRKNKKTFGGDTYREVATYAGAFEPITGREDGTKNARNPDKSKECWEHAIFLACTLLTTDNMLYYEKLIPVPSSIKTQLFFVGTSYFLTNVSKDNISGSGFVYNFGTSAGFIEITDVVIVFSLTETLDNPPNKAAISGHDKLNTIAKQWQHNIFFNIL